MLPALEPPPSELELLAAAAGMTADELRDHLRAEVERRADESGASLERARAAWLRATAGLD